MKSRTPRPGLPGAQGRRRRKAFETGGRDVERGGGVNEGGGQDREGEREPKRNEVGGEEERRIIRKTTGEGEREEEMEVEKDRKNE